jgi:methionyl-tRNA formyltransferase
MIIAILGDKTTPAYIAAHELVVTLGHTVDDGSYFLKHLAIAPLLTTKLDNEELSDPVHGTLIFHPSPLPWGRGAAAIKNAYKHNDPITAATWFWANAKLDGGDICEQEIISIDFTLRPRDFYIQDVIPAMLRTLSRALVGIDRGYVRRIPQIEKYSSYD